jgi:putative IMPACT (imprinted ancient) family translation regulator
MTSNALYRTNAEDCLRMAQAVESDRDKSFWLNLAQSWLQLAERSVWGDRSRTVRENSEP